MSRAHETVVGDQFGPRAKAYVESAVHAAGQDLDALENLVRKAAPARALDLGTGGGHVTYRLARSRPAGDRLRFIRRHACRGGGDRPSPRA